MISAGAGFAAAIGVDVFAFVSAGPAAAAGAFFSGRPNLAARAAKTSSLMPKLADLSIALGFSFFAGGALGVAVDEAGATGLDDEAGADDLGLNSRPNRSARRLRASSSGDKAFSVVSVVSVVAAPAVVSSWTVLCSAVS